MKDKKVMYHSFLFIAGLVLIILAFSGKADPFWNGVGSALFIMGGIRLLRTHRLNKNPAYREKVEIETTDERNKFIRSKAWSWAGYLFILITGISVFAFKLAGQELLCLAASWAVCLMMVLYWAAYHLLKKKY